MSDTLELGDGHWKLLVAPSLGGSLLACEHDGLPVLQPVAQPVGARRLSSHCCHIPLIPFSNRIENGRFSFEGRSIRSRPMSTARRTPCTGMAGRPHGR